ncbi:MAG: ring-cleaving dioxygenase [Janthinobacterium lividum]
MSLSSTLPPLILGGLHHITAVTGQAAANVEFYTQILGLRLIKKTVNQDDVSAYHLFYGDETGHAGTEVTFFDWPQAGPDRRGTNTISEFALRVNGVDTLDWWAARLASLGIAHSGVVELNGTATLAFTDPEGQHLRLRDDGGKPGGTPWDRSPVPVEHGIRGLAAVTLTVPRLAPTALVLTDILGFRAAGTYSSAEGHSISIFETADGGAGTEVHIAERSDLPRGMVGRGGVHHVAFRTPGDVEQQQWHQRLQAAHMPVSDLIDRFYFHSLYFREPNGILFEIATDGPGFATDEDLAHLGERLALPPFLEPRRAQIEAGLKPIG